jgi:arylsulfatase A-like enzyme
MDLFPTFCEVAGVKPAVSLDGLSCLPVLLGQSTQAAEQVLFWMRREGTLQYNGKDYYAVQRGNWYKTTHSVHWSYII